MSSMNEVKKPGKPLIFYYAVALIILVLFNALVMPWFADKRVAEVDYGTFMTMTDNREIGKVQIQSNQIVFTDKAETKIYKTAPIDDPGLTDRLHQSGAKFAGVIIKETSPLLSFLLTWILPVLIFFGLGQLLSRQLMKKAGGNNSMMFNMGKSNAKVYVKSSDGIKFNDVAGEDEAKENLAEIVDYLHNPQKYSEVGASMPKGLLLVGPPGTGKTMLAKAVAGEANVPFFSMSGSEFVEMFVGMGASKVRDLFKQAKEKAPCIVFIDEIDAIGQKRDGRMGGNDEREQTLNQLLTEMDGFEGNNGVIILAATNRPETLDPALTRPGRFDRRVPVELPDLKGREEILKVHAQKIRIAPDTDFNRIARMASGASGAELANIVNEAALRAVRSGRKSATQADLEESIEVVIAGYQKKNAILTDKEKRIVAYHEIGHALVAAKQTNSAPVQKIIYKLMLICFIGSFVGVVIETLWCLLTRGYIESRAGLVYGPFNMLYGAGAVVLSLTLYKFRNKGKWISFLGGFVVGSAVEYICSWGQELVLGSRSWDYSHMPFHINGRICLLYSIFWGILGVLWIKAIYPWMAKLILKIPNGFGKTITWLVTVFLIVNIAVSMTALFRWSQRQEMIAPSNPFWEFVDERFPDERMERIYANMEFGSK